MRLGAPVFQWRTAEEWAQRHVENGFSATNWPLKLGADPAQEEAFVNAAKKHDIMIAEVGVWNNLLEYDAAEREQNTRYAVERLKTADRVGARCCVNISGSLSVFWDGPHPNNLTEGTFRQIVQITQRILDEAQPKHTFYTLESMPWMYPNDIESTQRLLSAVNRPNFAVHVDICNLINAFDKVYKTREITREFFGAFKDKIRSVHAKDTVLAIDELTLHISEAIPGQGLFDLETLLTECSLLDDVPVMAEHLQTEADYRAATDYLKKTAQTLGTPFHLPLP